MKIQVLSDLHLEFIRSLDELSMFIDHLVPLEEQDRDVLIIAGDLGIHSGSYAEIGTLINALVFFAKHYNKVFYVLGNHEFYHSSFVETVETMGRIESVVNGLVGGDVVKVMRRERVEYKDQGFVGCTLWFNERPENILRIKMINDFRFISDSIDVFHREADADFQFISSSMRPGDIIITHHLPSHQSVGREFKGSPANVFFVHDYVENMLHRSVSVPSMWIHGHTHGSQDYMLGDIRVVCNPGGYPHKNENPNFNPNMIIEV